MNGKCAVFEEMEVKGKNMLKKYKCYKYNNMKKSYKLNSFTLWGVLTFLLMMFGLHIGAMAQSDDCISEAQPIRTYIFLTTQDGGAHWDTAAIKNIKDGQSVPRPEFTVIDYSTFDAWHTVSDPASFSDDNKFPESNFSTAQSITVTDTLRLYASYTLEVYHVIFMDGVSDEARVFRVWEVVAGTTGLNPNNETVVVDATTRSVGWYYDPALTQHATTFTMPAHDTILYPDIKTGHWLRFLSNGGTYVEPVFYQADATTQAPAEPSRTGYTFNGWLNGTEGWTPGSTLTEDITLTADWVATEVNYTVVYWVENADDQNYSFNNAQTVAVAAGTHITTLASGYTATTNIINGLSQHVTTFSYDKNTQADATDVTVAGDGSTVINLYYKRKTYTLTFDPSRYYSSSSSGTSENRASGQTTATITAKYGANIWNQFPISRNIRAFLSFITHSTSMWKATNTNVYSYALQTISTMPGANVTFYLYYNGNETEHTIYYDLENIEGTGYDRKAVSTFFNFVTYTEEYCDIQGFSKQTEAEAGFNNQHRKDFGSDGTVTLLYFRNSYAIRFYNGGEELNSLQETRKYEQEIGTLPVLSDADAPAGKTGFTFGGWYQNELCEGDSISSTSTMPAAEVVLYAKWNAPQYTATIHLTTSPSGETNDISVAYGETVPESELATAHPCPGSEPAAGWTILNEDGSTTVFEGDMLIYRDITLVPYCLLTGERYTITYNMNCAGVPAVNDNNEYADGSNPMVLPPSKDSCDNNTFLGWEEITTDGDYIVHSPYNGIYMTGDKTLSALWGSATEHTVVEMVEHHPTDGDVTASLEVITNGTTLLELPTTFERDETDRPNDWFIGWSQNENAQVAEFGPGESVVLSCDATIYPVWMQITPNDLNRTVCAGTEMDMNEFDAFSIHTDDYTHGLASNIVDSIWSITKDGEEFTAHEDGLITNAEPGIYEVSLTLKTAKNVEKTFSNTITLSVVEQFEPVFNSLQTLICQGYSVDLPQGSEEAAVSGSDNVIPSVLGKWMATDDSGSPVEVSRVPTDEVGRITLTFVPDEGQCASEISVDFTVVAPPAVVIEGDQLICSTDGSVMLTATVNPLANDETYQWMRQMEDGGKWQVLDETSASYTATQAGTYMVEVTGTAGCIVNSDPFEITVMSVPTIRMNVIPESFDLGCNPENIPVLTAADFTVNDDSNADAEADVTTNGPEGEGCAKSQTWTATYSNDCGEADPVSITYYWKVDNVAPVIATEAENDKYWGCTVPDAPEFTYTDNCDEDLEISVTTSGPVGGGCDKTQTWTANVSDHCGNPAESVSITYYWKVDNAAPVIFTEAGDNKDWGCTVPDAPEFTYTDNCDEDLEISVTTNGPEGEGCDKSQTWTANVSDHCGNPAESVSITYYWKVDNAAPVIATEAENDKYWGCTVPDAPEFTYTDNCDEDLEISVTTNGPEGEGCDKTQTWTANVSDHCGNPAESVSITYYWKADNAAPVIVTEAGDYKDWGCTVPDAPEFTYTDNCDEDLEISVTTNGPEGEGCDKTQTWTANVSDHCGNPAESVSITYYWKVDNAAPVIATEAEDDKDWGCTVPDAPEFTYTDNCDEDLEISVTTNGPEGEGCNKSQTWTANVSDHCGNPAEEVSITYTWTEDNDGPEIVPTEFEGIPFGNCQFAIPDLFESLLIYDQCSSFSFVSQNPEAGTLIEQTGEPQTISVTVVVEDACGNPTTTTIDVAIPAKLDVVAEANPTTVNVNGSAVLTATTSDEFGNVTYEWTPAASLDVADAATVTATPTVVGENTYTVTATDENGCEASAMVTVNALNRNVTVSASASKVYDGTPLEVNVEDITIEGLNEGDYLDAGTLYTNDYVVGVYTCPDNSFQFMADEQLAIKSGFVIKNASGEVVTANYTPTFDVTLSITAKAVTITAASDSKQYDGTALTNANVTATGLVAGDQLVAQVSGSQTEVGSSPNEIVDYTITRNGRDVTGSYSVTPVNGTLTVFNANIECEGVTYQGYDYPAVQIGNQCWLAENLRNTVYGPEETTAIADYAAYKNDEANMEKFGYLYTWYSAVGVEENNNAAVPETLEGTSLVQGICPEGWVVPSQTDFDILYEFTANEARRLRDMNTMYWIPGEQGVEPNYHFNSRAGGFYNSTSGQFERMLFEDYYWTSTSDPNTTEVTTPMNAYYCNSINFKTSKKSDKRSVRCISAATAYDENAVEPVEPVEPEPFRCGTTKMVDADGNEYETVQIGTQCWTKTNLRSTKDKNGNTFRMGIPTVVETMWGPSLSYDFDSDESMVYIPDEEDWYYFSGADYDYDATVIGYYYNWEAAQVACPDGWHLPSQEEWNTLVNYVSSQESYVCGENNSISKALSSEVTNYWPSIDIECAPGKNPSANNATGFSGVPAGLIQVQFSFVTTITAFWSTTNYDNGKPWAFSFGNGLNLISGPVYKYIGNSVRCLRDAEE